MACKAAGSEGMRLVELPRRVGTTRVPDVELATRCPSELSAKQAAVRMIRTPIEWAAKTIQSERMRVGEKRIPDVELAIR